MGFGRPGRREVDFGLSENPSFDRCTGKVGVGDPPSSPASPTKEIPGICYGYRGFSVFMTCFDLKSLDIWALYVLFFSVFPYGIATVINYTQKNLPFMKFTFTIFIYS